MVTLFNGADWYWIVGGNGPHKQHADAAFTGDETRVYSSKAGSYVPADDPTYVAWRSETAQRMGIPNPTTRIDTEDNLSAVLAQHGITAHFTTLAPA